MDSKLIILWRNLHEWEECDGMLEDAIALVKRRRNNNPMDNLEAIIIRAQQLYRIYDGPIEEVLV